MGKRWTEDEVNFLVENYSSMKNSDLAELLDRTYTAIKEKAKALKIRKNIKHNKQEQLKIEKSNDEENFIVDIQRNNGWSKEEVKFLEMYYEDNSIRDLAKALGRSEGSVGNKVRRMGLRRKELKCKEGYLICKECEEELPVSMFYKNKTEKTGYSKCCKVCTKLNDIKKRELAIEEEKNKLRDKMVVCSKCGVKKHGSNFNVTYRTGKATFDSLICRECRGKYDTELELQKIKDGRLW